MAVNLHTTHFRWGVDELAESTHGWYAAEDANPAVGVLPLDTVILLRFNEQETGGTAIANVDGVFEFRINSGAWTALTTTSAGPRAVAAVALTNGSACTKRLSGTGTFETTGAGQTEDGTSGGAANDIAASGCSETECGIIIDLADVAFNDVIQFRLTSPDTTVTNDVVPSLTIGARVVSATESLKVDDAETTALQVGLSPNESDVVAATETGTAEEVSSGPVVVDTTESLLVGVSEIVDRLLASIDPVETAAVRATETPDRLDVVFDRADTSRVGVDEVALLLASLDPQETAGVGATESLVMDSILSGADSLLAGLTEGNTDALLSVFDPDSLRVALSEQADSVSARLEAGEILPIGLADALGSLAVTLTDAEAVALLLGESLVIDVLTDAGETIPVVLSVGSDAPMWLLTATDTVSVGAGSAGEAGEYQGAGGARHYTRLSWAVQHEQWGGPA